MKLNFTLLLIFTSFFANAKYTNATIYYNDGQSEKGLINSFLENNFFDFNFFGTFEEGLVYNDKSIKFKLTEEADSKRISIDEIDKIILHYEGFEKEYKALFIRNISRKGIIEESKTRIFLPLLRSGKINLYGFYHRETHYNHDRRLSAPTTSITEKFYLQNANENYAIDYYEIELQDVFSLRDRLANPLKVLFKDCPDLVAKIHSSFYDDKKLSKEEKKKVKEQNRATMKALQKEYKDIPKDQKRGDLLLFHEYNLKPFEDFMAEYERCN